MTFRRERYPKEWPAIRAAIIARAGNVCEQCRAPNGEVIARGEKGTPAEGTYMLENGEVRDAVTGEDRGLARGSEYDVARFTRVVLTVAHLDHDEQHNDPEKLRALDRADNARRAREGRAAPRAVGMLPGLDGGDRG